MAENNKRVLYFFPRLERRCEEICDRFSNSWLDGSSKKAKILNLLQKTRSSHDNNHLNDLQLTLLAMMQLKSIFNQHRHLHSKVLSILFKTSPTSSKTFKRYMLTFFKSLDEDEHLNSSSTWESIQKFFQHNDKYIAKKHNVLIEKIQRPTNLSVEDNHQVTTHKQSPNDNKDSCSYYTIFNTYNGYSSLLNDSPDQNDDFEQKNSSF